MIDERIKKLVQTGATLLGAFSILPLIVEKPKPPAVVTTTTAQAPAITSVKVVTAPEKITTQVVPQIEYKAPPEKIEKTFSEPECVSVEGHKLIDSGRYKPSKDELIRLLGFSSSEAEAVVKYDLCYVKYCTFSIDEQTYTTYYLVCRPYSIVQMSDVVWLWIKTDLDCRNVQCIAFWNDTYAYPLQYDVERDAYRYFVQYQIIKLIIQEIKDTQAVSTEEVVLKKPSEVCGQLKIIQQSFPFQMRVKKICVDTSKREMTVEL